jgi:hypothetical protein
MMESCPREKAGSVDTKSAHVDDAGVNSFRLNEMNTTPFERFYLSSLS